MAKSKATFATKMQKHYEHKNSEALYKAAIHLQRELKKELSKSPSPSKPGQPPGVKTGSLRRSIQVDDSQVKQGKIKVGTNVIYAKILEYGGIIKAKTAKFLRFKIEGKWITKKTIRIKKRPYFRPTIKREKKEISKIIGINLKYKQ